MMGNVERRRVMRIMCDKSDGKKPMPLTIFDILINQSYVTEMADCALIPIIIIGKTNVHREAAEV